MLQSSVMNRAFGALLISLTLAGSFFIGLPNAWAAGGTQQAPKLLNLWLDWDLTSEDVKALSKWDFIVLDMDQQGRHPDQIRALRTLNPNIRIIAYIDSSDIASARFVEETYLPGYKLAHRLPEEWFLHRGKERVGYWSGAWMLNNTDVSPKDSSGKRWSDYLPEFIQTELWSSGLWDGFFLDNALIGPTWFVGNGLDMNGDGKADNDAEVNASWKSGWIRMAKDLRSRLGSKAILVGNGASEYSQYLNGVLFENFPTNGWSNTMKGYTSAVNGSQKPVFSCVNSNSNNTNNAADYRSMRMGLISTMLSDGYYSFDYGDRDHGQAWWYDEYDASLGGATGAMSSLTSPSNAAIADGVWWREYEKGAVVVNSTSKTQHVDLPSVYERLRGTQDPKVNSGRLETSIDLPPNDALMLYRRTQTSSLTSATAFSNGTFVRVYDAFGTQVRSSFFAQQSGVTGAAQVVVADADRDGKQDIVSALQGVVRINYGNGKTASFRPFGTSFKGALTIAAGNVDRDEPFEIAVGREGSDQAALFELNGSVRATWHAYTPAFKGGITVAIGDLNGDGLREVVTGAGPTGGPQIRIFKTDGALWSPGFFAFDKRERGGVSVAVGDLDKDGKDEIIAGSGQGTVPRVRIFSSAGALIREFTLDRTPSDRGVSVSLADIDGNGSLEILASGIRVTQ
jgi:hypothetical protein